MLDERDTDRAKIQSLEEKCRMSDEEARRLKQDMHALRNQQVKLEEEKRQLGTFLTSSAGEGDEPNNQDVINAFIDIRGTIQKLVRRLRETAEPISTGDHAEFYEGAWMVTTDASTRPFLLRAKIFDIINENLLSRRCFGLIGDTEEALMRLEEELLTSGKDCEPKRPTHSRVANTSSRPNSGVEKSNHQMR